MKTIELRIAKENVNGKEFAFSTYELLLMIINNTPQGGMGIDEIMKRLRLLEKLDAHKEQFGIEGIEVNEEMVSRVANLKLEDSDYTKIVELAKQMKWNIVSKFIIDTYKQLGINS